MSQSLDIAVLVGSLRAGSFNRMLAEALIARAPARLTFRFIEIGDVPFYNSDLEGAEAPPAWLRLRDEIRAADGVLFVTPEYNRSVPAALKNALDVGSRPMGSSVWAGKPAGVITASPGGMGGFGANHHLRQSLVVLDMPTMPQPEAYIGHVNTMFDEAGALKPENDAFVTKLITAFDAWVARHVD